MTSIRRPPTMAWVAALAIAACAAACSGGPNDTAAGSRPAESTACDHAMARLDELHVASLLADPVLASAPEIAREHARQTRSVYVAPRADRCADPAFLRCIESSTTFAAATACP
jgi:hypothetical protein